MHRFALPCLCGLALAVLGACGGASPDNFSGTGGHVGGSGSGGSSGGGSSHSGSSGSGGSGGASSSGASGGSSSGGSGSSSGSDDAGGEDASNDSSSAGDVADGGAPRQLLCKSGTQSSMCAHDQSCCISTGFTGTMAACQNGSGCTGTTIHCAGTADCPGSQVCCATGTTTGLTTSYTDLSCVQSCPAGTGFTARYQVCDAMGTDCPSGKTCTASTSLTGYDICR